MTDTQNKEDEKFNETLKRMLKTPHEPHGKLGESKPGLKQKPDGNPAKNDRPEEA